MMNLIQNVSQITNGFQLSPNMLLEHMTSGALNKITGKWMPQLPTQLVPWLPNGIFSQGFPLLSLVQNLQLTSGTITENLINEFGSGLNLQAGVLTEIPKNTLMPEGEHFKGFAIDISVDGFVNNPFFIIKDIQKIVKYANTIVVSYGTNTTTIHIEVDPNKIKNNWNSSSKLELPIVYSVDLVTNEIKKSIEAMRGFT